MQVDSDDDAFRVRESDNVTINGFMINGGERGVRAKRSSGLTVTNNVMNNVEEGVRLRECSAANIMNNTVLGTSRGRGIRIDKSDDVTVDGNAVSGAAREGLRAKRANGLWITSGSFDGNRGGVRLTRVGAGTSGDSLVTGISASGNTRTGIRVRAGTGTSVSGNTANDNGRYGLRLEGSLFSLEAAQADNSASGNCNGDFRVNNQTVGGGCGGSTSTSSTSSTSSTTTSSTTTTTVTLPAG
jgi:parallel beta-helix repeat protein